MLREETIRIIKSYHHDLGNQSWLSTYLSNCQTGDSLETISSRELSLILAYMEDDYADL